MKMVAEKSPQICEKTPLCRRSKRLQRKVEAKELCDHMIQSPLGYFSILPQEIMFNIFSTLSIPDLSYLTLVSKSLRDMVMTYNLTKPALMRLIAPGCSTSRNKKKKVDLCHRFKDLGLLMKRSTCIYPTKERLKIMEVLFQELTAHVEIESLRINFCFGQFLNVFVKGWEERECQRAYFAVIDNKNLLLKMANVLTGKPGSNIAQEMEVRSFLRGVILDQCDSLEDLAMWLHFILKPYPMVHQARLLMLLYGPLSKTKDQIDWTFMTSDEDITSPLSSVPFRDLSIAIKALHKHKEWNTDSVISVLEELTACPDEWETENIARLLVMTGEGICIPVLASKAINGKTSQLSSIIVALALVSYLSNLNMSWLIQILKDVCLLVPSEHDVVALIDAVVDYFRHIIVTLPEQGDLGPMMMFEDMVDAYTCFTKQLMMTSLLPSIASKQSSRTWLSEE